jgi:hypothetical protein
MTDHDLLTGDQLATIRFDAETEHIGATWKHTLLLVAEVERLRHALTNVGENLRSAGVISDVAKADILRAAAGAGTPTDV